MDRNQALGELGEIRKQLDALNEAIFRSLEGAEEAAKEGPGSMLAKFTEAMPIDRLTLYKALFTTMNAVDALASHVEYLLRKESP